MDWIKITTALHRAFYMTKEVASVLQDGPDGDLQDASGYAEQAKKLYEVMEQLRIVDRETPLVELSEQDKANLYR